MARCSARLVATVLQELERCGVAVEEALEGQPLTLAQIVAPGTRVEWDPMVGVLERAARACGGLAALEDAAAASYLRHRHPLGKVLRLIASPQKLYQLGVRRLMPVDYPFIRFTFDTSIHPQIGLGLELPPELRGGDVVWCVIRGLLRGLPGLLGLHESAVEVELGSHAAHFVISPPASLSIWARLRRAYQVIAEPDSLIDDLGAQQARLQESYDALSASHQRLEEHALALRESEERYRAVVENSSDGIAILDRKGTILFINPYVEDLTGLAPDAIIGRSLADLLHPDDVAAAMGHLRLRLADPDDRSRGDRPGVRIRHSDGRLRWVEIGGVVLPGAEGPRVIVVARDVTARRHVEEEREAHARRLETEVAARTGELERINHELRALQTRVIQAERLGVAQDLAGSVAHSINNPLTALIGHVQMMIEIGDETPERLERLLKLALRIRDVVSRTLQLVRNGSLELGIESPATIADEACREIEIRCAERGVRIETKLEQGLQMIEVDGSLIRAALVSLLENALEATPEGGCIFLKLDHLPSLGVVEIRIEDQGPGIPPDLLDRVFDPFFTTKPSGTGLGLSIARGVIRGHEGRVTLGDRPGGGTVARVELPARVGLGGLSARIA